MDGKILAFGDAHLWDMSRLNALNLGPVGEVPRVESRTRAAA
jgi:hypothetical protein